MRNLIHHPDAQRIEVLDQRFYTHNGVDFYPGSTTILDAYPKGDWFVKWLKENGQDADKIRDDAAAQGSAVHNATEAIDNGCEIRWADDNGKPFFSLGEWQMILNYDDFKKVVSPVILANERVLCSDSLEFGGTLDRIVEFGDKRWVLDIKTSNQISDTFVLQTASYAKLWNERHPEMPVDDCCVLWLKSTIRTNKVDEKKGIWQGRPLHNPKGWQIITFPEHFEDAYKDFEHVKSIWKRANPNYKPLNLIYPDRINAPVTLVSGDPENNLMIAEKG